MVFCISDSDLYNEAFPELQIFSRYEIIVGSLIRLDIDKYRPEGWTALDKKTPSEIRPANVGASLTLVTEEWWGDFNYRAFNLRKTDKNTTTEMITSGFRIYVPVVKTTELTADDVAFLQANELDASEYRVLDFEHYLNRFYNSISSSKLFSPNEDSAQYGRFIGTELFTRYDLSIGSIIRLDSGYKYRPEGWYDLDDKTTNETRPANVAAAYTEVTLEWWSTYAYRGFNLAKNTTDNKVTSEDISAIRIYVKI